jgi:ribose/xylose/arabinose/galactoside ABC-type transport system permease subunit
MSFAEIILRIGTAIGGWLIFIGYALVLAVLDQADCDPRSDELWRGTLLFAALGALALVFVGRGLEWSQSIRWFGIPAILLAALAASHIVPAFLDTTLNGQSLCSMAGRTPEGVDLAGLQASAIERVWPPSQLAVLLFGVIQAIRYWTAKPQIADSDDRSTRGSS